MTATKLYNSRRRLFVQSMLASGVCALAPSLARANTVTGFKLASAYKDESDGYGVAVMNSCCDVITRSELPDRGHASLFNAAHKQLLTFARRPGLFIHVLDLSATRQNKIIASVEGRHFYGHGCFNSDGTLLFTTENDFDAARGVIGIYDVGKNYQRIGEFPSFGVGPHDIRLLADGSTLLIANGGIETHPDTGREKLNLWDMASNLAFVNSKTGQLIKTVELAPQYQKLSLRHLAMNESGECFIAGQYQGAREDQSPLVGTVTQAGEVALWPMPTAVLLRLKDYISSIKAIPKSPLVAISSSKGGVVVVWNSQTNQVEELLEIADVSGLATIDHQLVTSDGAGALHSVNEQEVLSMACASSLPVLHWDNHLLAFADA